MQLTRCCLESVCLTLGLLAIVPAAVADTGPGGGGPMGAPARQLAEEAAQNTVTMRAQDRDLRNVISEFMRKTSGVTVIIDPEIEEDVTIEIDRLDWLDALRVIAEAANCKLVQKSARLFYLTQPPRVFMQFDNADLSTIVTMIGEIANRNIVMSPQQNQKVSFRLQNVDWWEALHIVVKQAGLIAIRETDDIVRIVTKEQLADDISMRVYPLNYLHPPSDYHAVASGSTSGGEGASIFAGSSSEVGGLAGFTILTALKAIIQSYPGGGSVEYNKEANALMVFATAKSHEEIKNLLTTVDIEPQQVFIDVKFVSTTNKNFWRDGLRIGDPAGSPGTSGFTWGMGDFGDFPFTIGNGLDAFQRAFEVPATLTWQQMEFVWRYVDVDQMTKVTLAPTLLTLNDHAAVIFVGEKVPFAEQTVTVDASGNAIQTVAESGSSPAEIGFTLFVTPHIIRNQQQILLSVIPRVTRLSGTQANGLERFTFGKQFIDLPRVQDQTVMTNLLVQDRNTAIIGGLIQESISEIEQRIPLLSGLPFIGDLFTWDQKDYVQENLIIFITPRIVRSTLDSVRVFNRQYQQFQNNDHTYHKYTREKEAARQEARHNKAPAGEVQDEDKPLKSTAKEATPGKPTTGSANKVR